MKSRQLFIYFSFCLLLSTSLLAGDRVSFLKRQFTTTSGYRLNYRILYPANYSPDRQYPVILFLHGAGERGSDNEAQLRHGGALFASHQSRTDYPAIVIAPQCPEEQQWSVYSRPMGMGQKRVYPPAGPITPVAAAVMALLDSYIDRGVVDTQRIYITGLSMGGMGTFDLVCRYPNLFAAATPICGGANLQRLAAFKGRTAFSIYHGAADKVVDVVFSQDAYRALQEARADVRYKEYPDVDHNSWDNAFAEPDYLRWMYSHP